MKRNAGQPRSQSRFALPGFAAPSPPLHLCLKTDRLDKPMWIGNVIIYRNLAYVPVMHTLNIGGWYTGEPVTVVPVTVEDLTRAIAKVRRAGNPPVSALAVAMAADPVLRSTGAQTWGRLALYAVSYEIDWTEEGARLTISMRDDHGRFVDDPARERNFGPNVPVAEIAAAIVADWQARNAQAIAPPS